MANVDNTLLNNNQTNVGIDKENQIQGLFFDLLACLGGGDSSTLPANYAQKPMTGFCEILDAFNEVIKIHETGSGTVCEVNSTELTTQSSFEGISSESNGSLKPVESQHLFSTSDSTLCSTDCENGTTQESTIKPIGEQVGQTGASTPPQKVEVSETDEFHDTLDTLETNEIPSELGNSLNVSSDANNNVNLLETPEPQMETVLPQEAFLVCNAYNPALVEEIGPPLTLTKSLVSLMSPHHRQPDLPPEIVEMERDVHLYSDEIREIERILKEHVLPPHPDYSDPSILIGSGVVESISDGLLVSPRSGLQTMYENESRESSRQPKSTYLSTYQSCTSFENLLNHPEYYPSNPLSCRVNEQTPSSVYIDCLNSVHSGSVSVENFFTALESINPSFICAGTERISEIPEVGIIVPDQSNLDRGDTVIYQPMPCTQAAGEKTQGDEEPDTEKSSSKNSVDPTSNSEVDSMTDGEDSNISLRKKNKKKSGYKTASSEEEHLWTSVSPSDFEDVENTMGE